MPQRKNLKPTLPDTLRQLRHDITAGNTVPHGVKTVQPGEGMQLIAPQGVEDPDIFWGWETATNYRNRIDAAQETIAGAAERLDAAEQNIAAGTERINENIRILDELAPEITGARQTAEQAAADLGALAGTVGDVRAAADAAARDAKAAVQIGVTGNLFPDSALTSQAAADSIPNGWQNGDGTYTIPANTVQSGVYLGVGGGRSAELQVPVLEGYTYLAEATVVLAGPVTDGRAVALYARAYDSSGQNTWAFTQPIQVNADPAEYGGTLPAGVPIRVAGEFTIPAGYDRLAIGGYSNGQHEPMPDATWSNPQVRMMTPGALVVNGSITGKQIEGESVAARVVDSLTARHRRLIVTEDALLAQAEVLGTLTAEEINSRRLIRGRDAILDGTVDIEQLHVTGEMAGTIARFMDVEARRAVFTEGMTANESTLLGTTIAEAINADAVAGRIMTGGKLQTTTAANRGVKIDGSGIRAWDNSGRETLTLNGSSNLVQGAFRTGTTGARILIDANADSAFMDVYGPNSASDHGSIIYTAGDSGPLNSSLTVMAMGTYSTDPNNPALRLFPLRGTFAFQGRWARDTDPIKFIVLTNSSGLRAGEYNTIDIPYITPFPTNNALRFPFVSVESYAGADVIATIVTQTDKMIRINVINKSGSKASGALVLKIATFNVGAF